MTIASELQRVTDDDIAMAVRKQTGDDGATVIEWTSDRLVGAGEALGVWRLTGKAIIRGHIREWSIVLKGWSAPDAEEDPAAFNWSHREMELYRSGLLADLPGGIRAPACYGSSHGDDGSIWVWLEDITDGVRGLTTLDDFEMVARRVGQFNGAWVTERPLPSYPALSQDWTRRWVEAAGPSLEYLAQLHHTPAMEQLYPSEVSDTYRHIWATRHAGYERIGRAPKTFAHLDVFPQNIFIREASTTDSGAPADIILIDWSFSGIAALGEDLGPLVMASVLFSAFETDMLDDLQELAVAAYLDGLRDSGWQGDTAEVITAYRISSALRYGPGTIRVGIPILTGDIPREVVESIFGTPFDVLVARVRAFQVWLAGQIREHEEIFG